MQHNQLAPTSSWANFVCIAGEACGRPSLMFLHGLYTQKALLQTAEETCWNEELGKSWSQWEGDRREEDEGESVAPLLHINSWS